MLLLLLPLWLLVLLLLLLLLQAGLVHACLGRYSWVARLRHDC
jgi:hypothetical protein